MLWCWYYFCLLQQVITVLVNLCTFFNKNGLHKAREKPCSHNLLVFFSTQAKYYQFRFGSFFILWSMDEHIYQTFCNSSYLCVCCFTTVSLIWLVYLPFPCLPFWLRERKCVKIEGSSIVRRFYLAAMWYVGVIHDYTMGIFLRRGDMYQQIFIFSSLFHNYLRHSYTRNISNTYEACQKKMERRRVGI